MNDLEKLQAEIERLQAENELLKTHQPYGILTRSGFEIERRAVTDAQFVVFSDIDSMHELNTQYGYEAVNKKIRSALQLRSGDLILTGLWFSGDEVVFVIRSNPSEFCTRVFQSFAHQGIGITMAFEKIVDGDVNKAIDIAARHVQGMKEARRRS